MQEVILYYLLDKMKDLLNITEVRFTNKLKTHPVCLTSKGNVSIEMEKVINAMPTDEKIKAETVMEINQNHKGFEENLVGIGMP